MISTIQPQVTFPISRGIPNPADASTYYIQAKVRRASDGLLLQTVDLSSIGNNLYVGSFQTPQDASGRGLYITITTSVFTDAGHTTKSDVYTEDSDTYFVYDQFKFAQLIAPQLAALIGGGADVDYKKIKKIVDAAEAALTKKMGDLDKEPDLSLLNPKFELLHSEILKAINDKPVTVIPEAKEVDLTPVLNAVANGVMVLGQALAAVREAIPEKTDLSPVLEALRKVGADDIAKILEELSTIAADLHTNVDDTMKMVKEKFPEVEQHLKDLLYATSIARGSGPTGSKAVAAKPMASIREGEVAIPRP